MPEQIQMILAVSQGVSVATRHLRQKRELMSLFKVVGSIETFDSADSNSSSTRSNKVVTDQVVG